MSPKDVQFVHYLPELSTEGPFLVEILFEQLWRVGWRVQRPLLQMASRGEGKQEVLSSFEVKLGAPFLSKNNQVTG